MMESQDVLEVTTCLREHGVTWWLDGGWGIDALLGEQTRAHDDLDLVIEIGSSDRALAGLSQLGFNLFQDERPTKFVVRDERDRRVDFHTVAFDEEGGGVQILQDERSYRYPPEGFKGVGLVVSEQVRCLTAGVQVECHGGYAPDRNDFHDMRLLRERFKVKVPAPFQMDRPREDLLERIRQVKPGNRQTKLVAIDGRGGSGKSSLAWWLASELEADVIHIDDFGGPGRPYDAWDWLRFQEQVLSPLRADQPARYQRYDWVADRLAEWVDVQAGGVVIVEGVSATRSELGDPWDVKVWVECPHDIRLGRGVQRDGESMRDTWVNVWMPQEDRYVQDQHPRERADVVIRGFEAG